jgi:hypothetical protein
MKGAVAAGFLRLIPDPKALPIFSGFNCIEGIVSHPSKTATGCAAYVVVRARKSIYRLGQPPRHLSK